MQSICEIVAQDKLVVPVYESPSGPVSPIDLIYGSRKMIAEGNEYMAHKGGFTYLTLNASFFEAGFEVRIGGRRIWELWIVAFKQKKPEEEMKKIATPFIPNGKFTS